MPTTLGSLQDASNIHTDGVRRHEDHLGCEAMSACELRLLNSGRGPKGRLDGERASFLDVTPNEQLAFPCNGIDESPVVELGCGAAPRAVTKRPRGRKKSGWTCLKALDGFRDVQRASYRLESPNHACRR